MININTAQALEGQMKNKIILIHSEYNLATVTLLCIFFL